MHISMKKQTAVTDRLVNNTTNEQFHIGITKENILGVDVIFFFYFSN